MSSSSPSPNHARLSNERRPKLLKDFLQDDPYSCSPNDHFRSHPRKLSKSTSSNFHGSSSRSSSLMIKNATTSYSSRHELLRSRSSRAATATISAINKVINVVKFLPFVKSPSINISRKISRRHSTTTTKVNQNVSVKVKVKDILRWKSFRDFADEKSTPLDYSCYSPYMCTTTTTTNKANYSTATTSTTTNTSSRRSSWCDSDFTAEDLPSWFGENGEFLGELLENGMKKVGRKNILEEGVGGCNKEEFMSFDENEQHSPVSVLESPFQEDDDEEEGSMAFSFHRSLANIDKKKSMLMQRLQHFESLAEGNMMTNFKQEEHLEEEDEEKAKKMLSHLKETNNSFMEDHYYELLFDFFIHEMMSSSRNIENNIDGESEIMLVNVAKSWINGEYNGEFEWEMEDNRESYINDMERVSKWNKFEEEKQELSLDLEFEVFNDLIHEVLEDVLSS